MRGRTLSLSLLRSPVYPDPLADEGYPAFSISLLPYKGSLFEGSVREEAEDLK